MPYLNSNEIKLRRKIYQSLIQSGMMEIEFIGVGEAFEPQLGNSSFLLKANSFFMIDCGYGVPRNLFERKYESNAIDAIYLTHFHADHLFGLPALLSYWKQENRTCPLTLIGQHGLEKVVSQILDLGYQGMQVKLTYPLHFIESETSLAFNEWKLEFAESIHSVKNLAIKIEVENIRIGISGDGALSEDSKRLFQNCHVLIHDAFTFDQNFEGHETAQNVISFAKTLPHLKIVALVHLQRMERKFKKEAFLSLGYSLPFKVLIPEPGEVIKF